MNGLTALIASAILAATLIAAPSMTSEEVGSQQLQPPTGEEEVYPVGPPASEVTEQ